MSKFLFEGNFKRKPVQNLGGRSRHAEDKDAVLLKAQLERQKRENERARFAAVQVLQAAFRGMRERKKLNLLLRSEFQKELAVRYTIDSLERQMVRLNYFFKAKSDVQLLCDLGKAMLILKDQLMIHMLQDERSMLRVRLVLEKALLILSDSQPQSRSTILRLLETFTDWSQIENARTTVTLPKLEPSRTEEVVATIWSHLVLQKDFFNRYKNFLNSKMEVKDLEGARKATQHYDFTIFYHRFLEAVCRLCNTDRKFTIGKTLYGTKELVQCLLLKLADSLSNGILRYKGQKESNGVLEFLVCPRVAHLLAQEQENGKTLWNEQWLSVILKLTDNIKFSESSEIIHSIKLRPVMYSFLVMVRFSEQWTTRQSELLNVLNALMISIDNRKMLFQMPEDEDIMDYEDEESFMDDIEMTAAEEAEAALEFFHDRQKIYQELQIVLNNMQLHKWIEDFTPAKWNLLYQVMSCIIEMEPLKAAIHFRFISSLYNNPRFMRSLGMHVMRKEVKDKVELVVLCWLLNQLMKILHDGEFMEYIPFSRMELYQFLKLLEDTYTDIVLSDKDVSDRLECYFKREIAHTLMSIHDRNTRIKIFPEDVFISSKFSVVFPMETHGIRFKDFSNPFGALSNLSLLDQRLLRVLNDFPFALSFHDRVSIWHQILHSDHVERHVIDNPMGRQHIQIRRTYIYEDAFDKLSTENVPDLRADVRISLVNVVGVQEAGVDGGGLLREFLTEATKAGVDPNRGLFRVDSENRIYPNPIAKRIFPDYMKHFFFMGRLVGKALYRQILLELPLAAFFMQLATFGSISSAVDYLATLDPDLHKNLLKLKTFDGDWSELGLDFTVASDELGEARIIELKPEGKNIAVDKDNVIEYIHLVADYKINKEIMEECRWFRSGLLDVVPVLRIFSWKEMQTLISGSDKPINVEDWKEHTNYAGGYSATHNTIQMFWQVVEHFDEEYLRKLLKFVTSCSRPPLLGFKDLVPKFGISNAGVTDRLPTAATCMNLLKLPEFGDIETLRERLVYAINAQAGFELS